MRNRLLFLVLCSISCLTACTTMGTQSGPIAIASVRPAPLGLQEIAFSIKKSEYSRALESSRGSQNLRIIPMVVSASQAPASPEYRIFNVKKGSVAELLGLENSDILVAAHDYVIQTPEQFYGYLNYVAKEQGSQIEVRRGGQPLLLKFQFID